MKLDKYITIFVVSIPILFISLYFASLIIYKNQWKHTFSKYQINNWVNEINETPSLGEKFYSVFDTLKWKYENNQNLNFEYLKLVKFHLTGFKNFHRGSGQNYYLEIADFFVNKYSKGINTLLNPKLVLAFGLEKNVELEKCIDYYYHNLESRLLIDSLTTLNFKGVEEFSRSYYKKEFTKLIGDEVITLISALDIASFKDTITEDLIKSRLKVNEYLIKRNFEKLKK